MNWNMDETCSLLLFFDPLRSQFHFLRNTQDLNISLLEPLHSMNSYSSLVIKPSRTHTHTHKHTHACMPVLTTQMCLSKFRDQNKLEERKVLFYLQVTTHHWGKPGQELKTEAWRQKLKQRPWRNAGLLCFSDTTQAYGHSRMGPPMSTNNQEDARTHLPTGQSDEGNSQLISTLPW